jgi:hypothetical protein
VAGDDELPDHPPDKAEAGDEQQREQAVVWAATGRDSSWKYGSSISWRTR